MLHPLKQRVSIILIAVPIVYPIINNLGFDGIWFCVLFNLNLEIAMLTSPVGMNLYVLAGATEDRFEEIVIASIPFALCLLLCMIILIVFPQIATWLPNTIR